MDSPTKTRKILRYNGVAIGLHWLIALLIIGMLAVGKLMTSFDESDPLRFTLTQWHKSFGILILLLSFLRLFWRLTHKPPRLPRSIRRWEKIASGFTHFVLYLLMIGVPLSGWIMVSASPLNITTHLFNLFPLPHLPPFPGLANKAEIAHLFHDVHEISSGIMIVLLLLHIGAALRHHFVQHDSIMMRMSADFSNDRHRDGMSLLAGAIAASALGLFLLNSAANNRQPVLGVGSSDVSFTLVVMGDDISGKFTDNVVELNLDQTNITASTLQATVNTASAVTGSPQIDDALPGPDWLDSTNYPQATFISTRMTREADDILVEGELSIRGSSRAVSFPMSLQGDKISGGFTFNRLDFSIGKQEQPDDQHAGLNVLIEFELDIEQAN